MKPMSGDWMLTINFLQKAGINSLSSGSSVHSNAILPSASRSYQWSLLIGFVNTLNTALDSPIHPACPARCNLNRLLQETLGKDPLDMGQYYRIFRTCRIPGLPEDSAYFPEPTDRSRHIVVVHNNEFFSVTILDENMRALDENQLLSQLRFVVEESPRPTKTVGILTSENRDTWAKYHRLLSQDPYNTKLLDVIEKSLFVLCLDGPAPDLGVTDKQSISGLQMVHGGGSRASGGNRWFDKALQVRSNSGKHPQDLNYSLPTVTFPVPLKLEFKLTPEVEQGIETACKNLDKLVADFEMHCSTFPAFGKDVIKSFKVSPDSFIQMALQLAFYR
uniref:Choline/carnitine acyltransferase domain-containing protein n=1 Tax=Timema shepardi TaxID=629360 RepID=A0A7R9AU76_TIMSH|nr:unnamed protein product [Timema shepardi]